MPNQDAELLEHIAEEFTHDPLGYVQGVFPWNERDLLGSGGPREWQANVLGAIGNHLSDPATRSQPCKIAVSSGHGIGKSALVAQIISWALNTCDDTKVVVTANTAAQLGTKTWPEVEKWFRLSETSAFWKVAATSVKASAKGHEDTWRADAITWSENNTEAFAGLHNKGKRIVLIFDEASAIADKVWEVAEGALTDEGTEIIWLAFGNPTQNTGRFFECFNRLKHRWKTFQVDSRTVDGTNKAQIATWIQDYGEDSDFVRVRVRGEFPRAGSNQFIPSDVVAACRKYKAEAFAHLPKVLSVDVARFGDDQSVVGTRQGRKVVVLAKYRGLDTAQLGERVIEWIQKEKPDATVVDGDGLGAGTIDHLKFRGFKSFEFHGGNTPNDAQQYFNRRAEVWGLMRDALKAGLEIPDDPELEIDLTGPQYGFSSKQQIQLEKKEDMKKRGLASPDTGDMIAMTFAVQLRAKEKVEEARRMYEPGQQSTGWMS
jgi:hypothetical protein